LQRIFRSRQEKFPRRLRFVVQHIDLPSEQGVEDNIVVIMLDNNSSVTSCGKL
jgi:hypothetical protein